MQIEPTRLPEVLVLTPRRFGDARGWFSETWNAASMAEAGLDPLPDLPAYVQSGVGEVRIGPILAIPKVLRELGFNPQTAFARAGVPLSLFSVPDARLPIESVGRLFAECASLSKCPHFGLLVGERFSLDSLGPLGELMRASPSVGSALRHLLQHLPMVDRSAAPMLLLLLHGKPNKLIARELNLSVETVKDHVAAVLRALGVSTRTQAVLAVSQMQQQAALGARPAPPPR